MVTKLGTSLSEMKTASGASCDSMATHRSRCCQRLLRSDRSQLTLSNVPQTRTPSRARVPCRAAREENIRATHVRPTAPQRASTAPSGCKKTFRSVVSPHWSTQKANRQAPAVKDPAAHGSRRAHHTPPQTISGSPTAARSSDHPRPGASTCGPSFTASCTICPRSWESANP